MLLSSKICSIFRTGVLCVEPVPNAIQHSASLFYLSARPRDLTVRALLWRTKFASRFLVEESLGVGVRADCARQITLLNSLGTYLDGMHH